jgi:Protein of unknown function (DUF3800)
MNAHLRSIAGAPFQGNKVVRLVYLDEAGVSPSEKILTVCGAIIHGDQQPAAIENYFNILIIKHIPYEDRPGFVFHATHIWSGGGYFKDRQKWPLEKRLEILDDLISIPKKFDFPVAYGNVNRELFTLDLLKPGCTQHDLEVAAHTVAFGHCCMGVELFTRKAFPNECVILIAEDRDSVRSSIKNLVAVFRNPAAVHQLGIDDPDFFPFVHIRDTVHFAKKDESRHLQIADTCSFVVRGHFLKNKHNDRFWDVIKPQLIWHPKDPRRSA